MASDRRSLLSSLSVLLLAWGCSGPSSDEPPAPEPPPSWQAVLGEGSLDRAALGVWGSGGQVFVVGGPLGNEGREALALRFDGERWHDLAPGGGRTLWWASGTGPSDVWMVGEAGRITHWDGQGFTEHEAGTTATLFGVWAASPGEAYAVGGSPAKGTGAPNDVVLRWDGSGWSPVALPGPPRGAALFKVWGSSSGDIYVVGEGGSIWHRKAGSWALEAEAPQIKGTLTTVAGCSPTEIYAVGQPGVFRSDGSSWARLDMKLSGQPNGVSCGAPGEAVVVGSGGLKMRLSAGSWADDFTAKPWADLHAGWADGSGNYWAVGGDFSSPPAPGASRPGVVARFGRGEVSGVIGPR